MDIIDKVAWVHLHDGKVLAARSQGKTLFYLPGGKREAGESDEACLTREIREELSIDLAPGTLRRLETFQAQADGRAPGVMVRMACYAAQPLGEPRASAEIAEWRWLSYADKPLASLIIGQIFDWLHERGELN